MSASDWVTSVLAFIGAGLGAGLSYLAIHKGTQQRESQGRREEWGRRFTAALGYLADLDPRNRALGRVIFARMARSELASTEERQLADDLLSAEAHYGAGGVDVAAVTSGESLDEIDFVADDGDNEGGQP